jgi:UDP:flavonoid glycosyltransferase YjiC (YdhE family)
MSYSWWKPIRELRRELGLAEGDSPLFAGKYSPLLNLALFSRELQPPQPDWPAHTVQTGFMFYDEAATSVRLPDDVQRFLSAGAPPIVFTLGSAAVHLARDFYVQAARAAALLGRRALLLLGKNPPPPNLSSSVLAWDYLPYAQVFRHAAAIVHQGGVGTTGQALRAGKPMLVMPFAHDQFDNAARVTRLGVGRRLAREKFTAESAARELRALFDDPAIAQKAAATGARTSAERGVDAACDAIEHALAAQR